MYRNKKSDSCGSVGPHLWEYAAGTLPANSEETARVEKHLAHCAKCRAECESFRAASEAMAAYASLGAESGIPPRAPNWEAVQMRLQQDQNERQKETSVSGVSWLRAMRTSPAFAGATVACGITTALCAVAIPWAVSKDTRETQRLQNSGPTPVAASAASEPSLPLVSDTTYSPVEMVVRPVFMRSGLSRFGVPSRGTYPLAVSVVNHLGRETKAHISVLDTGTAMVRRNEREVTLTADAKPQVFRLYPSVSNAYNPRPEFQVSLEGVFPRQETRLSYLNNDYSGVASMSLIGDSGAGALSPKQYVMAKHNKEIDNPKNQYQSYSSSSAKPENAPDRPTGYDSIDTLVLGQGAERLNPVQRAAMRQWVIGGGAVIVLPGAGLGLLGIAPDATFVNAKPVSRLLAQETPLHRYSLGMGAVLTVPLDLTEDRFREEWELPYVWQDLRYRAAPLRAAETIRESYTYSAFDQQNRWNDPFQIALPPLATVVYLFAGYFILAVPVTFVVLKQTRRMNWAWATGPALAVIFGGAVYGFTADLHKAKLSRRTNGTIVAAAGEKQARFVGASELFFPTAGNYDVTVPGAETAELETGITQAQYTGDNYSGNRDQGGGIVLRSLETVDNGTSVAVPGLNVPNLAFRRLHHAQPVAWGDGITTNLSMTPDGNVTGTIHNGTGRTLSNAYIVLQTATKETLIRNKRPYEYNYPNVIRLSPIGPGDTRLLQKPSSDYRNYDNGGMMLYNSRQFYRAGASPVLVGTTSGHDLGPTIGQYVGGPDSVTVAVTLPPMEKADNSASQGGVK